MTKQKVTRDFFRKFITTFDDEDGGLDLKVAASRFGASLASPGTRSPPSMRSTRRRVEAMAAKHAGALAFSRTGDPDSGSFGDADVIAVYGAVDTGGCRG